MLSLSVIKMLRLKEQTLVRSRCGVASHGDLYGAALVKQTAGGQQVSHPPGVVPGGRVHILLRETPGLGGSSLGELSRGSETVSSPWAPAGRSATVLHSGGESSQEAMWESWHLTWARRDG